MQYSRTLSSVAKETFLQRMSLLWQLVCLRPNPVDTPCVIVVDPSPLQIPYSVLLGYPLTFVFTSLELSRTCLNIYPSHILQREWKEKSFTLYIVLLNISI